MWRYLVGAAAALLLVAAGLVWQRGSAQQLIHPASSLSGAAADNPPGPLADPPAASDKTREEKRFSRYDHDHDGKVSADEFLLARHRAFAKLDANADGKLSFDEYAVKTLARFAAADSDKSGALGASEFAATRIVRHDKARCPPVGAVAPAAAEDDN